MLIASEMNANDLYRTQLGLEGIRFNIAGYLERFKERPGESGPPARVVVVNFGEKQSVYFGSGIDRGAEALIRALPIQSLLDGDRRIFKILSQQKKIEKYTQIWTYTASGNDTICRNSIAHKLSSRDDLLRGFSAGFFGSDYENVFTVIVDGSVVSAATSSREDENSAELWVYTSPEYRRQRFALQAALAWFDNIIDRGLIPYFSHLKDNSPSRCLAESLRLSLCYVLTYYS